MKLIIQIVRIVCGERPDLLTTCSVTESTPTETLTSTGQVSAALNCILLTLNSELNCLFLGPGASSSSCNDAFYGPSVMSEVRYFFIGLVIMNPN